MNYIDYYEVLGVAKTASDKEIKQAYRNLARKHHPDLHQDAAAKTAAEEKFKLINEAYEVLGDPEKRQKYDSLGMNWQTGDEFQAADGMGGSNYQYQDAADFDLSGFGFSDFFSRLFGQEFARGYQAGGHEARARGEDIDARIALTVDELIHGAEKELRLSAPNICKACRGQRFSRRGICQDCGGTGVTEEVKTVRVKIPAGLYPGASLRLKGLGGKGCGSAVDGDLYLQVQAAPSSVWRISGSDVETDLVISPDQAVCGDKTPVSTPHGQVQLKLQPGLNAGQRLRLKNKGLPKGNGANGDLYLRIVIDVPRQLTEHEQELYRQLRQLRQTRRSD